MFSEYKIKKGTKYVNNYTIVNVLLCNIYITKPLNTA